jgi:hypothetical protein
MMRDASMVLHDHVFAVPPAAAWYFTIVCVRFFRAPRGKTEHQQK